MAVPRPGGGGNDGWNDPPVFTYNASALGTSPHRTHLNKRVSFPLGTETDGNLAKEPLVPRDPNAAGMLLSPKDGPPKLPPVHILPPTTSTTVHPPVPLLLSNLSPPADHSALPPSFVSAIWDPQQLETLSELLQKLDLDSADSLRRYTKKVLHDMLEVCKDSIQGRSREDVLTRLSMLDDQWRDEKLTEKAKVKMGSLALAMKNNDLKQADSLHLALMVDHISEVNQWMVGVKRVINELKLLELSPLSLPDKPSVLHAAAVVEGEPVSADTGDVCIDTDKFTNLKPVLMPEVLVPHASDEQIPQSDGAQDDQGQPAEQQKYEAESSLDENTDKNVENKKTNDR